MRNAVLCLLGALSLLACSSSDDVLPGSIDSGADAADAADAGDPDVAESTNDGPPSDSGPTIPDPVPGDGTWLAEGSGTPGTAHRVGIVSAFGPYELYGTLDSATGNTFWVFRSGPGLTSIKLAADTGGSVGPGLEHLHLHKGDGLVMGALVTPSEYTVSNTAAVGIWPLVSDSIYVVELHGAGGTIF